MSDPMSVYFNASRDKEYDRGGEEILKYDRMLINAGNDRSLYLFRYRYRDFIDTTMIWDQPSNKADRQCLFCYFPIGSDTFSAGSVTIQTPLALIGLNLEF